MNPQSTRKICFWGLWVSPAEPAHWLLGHEKGLMRHRFPGDVFRQPFVLFFLPFLQQLFRIFRIGELLNQILLIPHYFTYFFVLMYYKSICNYCIGWLKECWSLSLFWVPSFIAWDSLDGGGSLCKCLHFFSKSSPKNLLVFSLSITLTLSSNYPIPCL